MYAVYPRLIPRSKYNNVQNRRSVKELGLRCSSSVSLSSLAVSLAADLCLLVAEATGEREGQGRGRGGAEGRQREGWRIQDNDSVT